MVKKGLILTLFIAFLPFHLYIANGIIAHYLLTGQFLMGTAAILVESFVGMSWALFLTFYIDRNIPLGR